jgi:uncharacterized membrane protein
MEDIIRQHLLTSRPRLLISLALGLLTIPFSTALQEDSVRALIGWDVFAFSYTLIVLATLTTTTGFPILRQNAAKEDETRWMLLLLLSVAAVLSLVAIATQFTNTKSLSPMALHLHLGLAALTIVGSWSFIHTLFAIHYAHEYFGDADKDPDNFVLRGGLEFPRTKEPVFSDFLYYSYVVGMTCQVSDVQVTHARMRRLTLIHGILSFFFNTIILALSVNFAASIIS